MRAFRRHSDAKSLGWLVARPERGEPRDANNQGAKECVPFADIVSIRTPVKKGTYSEAMARPRGVEPLLPG
jgi:hypothetical protein